MTNYDYLAAIGSEFFVEVKDHGDIYFIEEYERQFDRLNAIEEGLVQMRREYPEVVQEMRETAEKALRLLEGPIENLNEEVDTIWWNEQRDWRPVTEEDDKPWRIVL